VDIEGNVINRGFNSVIDPTRDPVSRREAPSYGLQVNCCRRFDANSTWWAKLFSFKIKCTPGSRSYSDFVDSVCIHQLVLKPRSKAACISADS